MSTCTATAYKTSAFLRPAFRVSDRRKAQKVRGFRANGTYRACIKDCVLLEVNCGSGQIMAYINDPKGRLCDWGIPRTECWGVRLPSDYKGEIPPQMFMTDIPEGEYIVFEHGAFDYEQENCSVEEKIEDAMANFDYAGAGYCLDTSPGRIMYFYYNPEQYFKYIRPVQKLDKIDYTPNGI